MIRKTALAVGIGAVAVLGAKGTAIAAQSDSTQATPTPTTTAAPTPTPSPSAGRHRVNVNFPGEYAQWTTFDARTNTSTVYDGIRGQVSAVSGSSISVKAANGTSQTFAVDANTRVRGGKGKSGGIGQVQVGERVVLVGTGQGSFTAVQVNDGQRGGKHR